MPIRFDFEEPVFRLADDNVNPSGKLRAAEARFEAAIGQDPNDAYAHVNMGLWWHWEGAYGRALERFDAAIQLDPRFAHALCARASLRGTCPDPRYREGELAVRDATVALAIACETGLLRTNWQHRMYLDTLAGALAEQGDFDAAVRVQRETLPFCITRISEERARALIVRYQERLPLRSYAGLVSEGTRRP